MDMLSLGGKTALVTGASRGIGKEIAGLLAAYDARMILISRKIDNLHPVEEEIRKAGGLADSIACHVGKMEQIEALFKEIEERYPKLDILINNAGANPFFGDLLNVDEKAWDSQRDLGGKNRIHVIDQDKCIKCWTCFESCPPRFGAVTRISGAPVPLPIPEEKRTIIRKG